MLRTSIFVDDYVLKKIGGMEISDHVVRLTETFTTFFFLYHVFVIRHIRQCNVLLGCCVFFCISLDLTRVVAKINV